MCDQPRKARALDAMLDVAVLGAVGWALLRVVDLSERLARIEALVHEILKRL